MKMDQIMRVSVAYVKGQHKIMRVIIAQFVDNDNIHHLLEFAARIVIRKPARRMQKHALCAQISRVTSACGFVQYVTS